MRSSRIGSDGWQELGEKDIEFEEEAQKAELSELYGQLDERDKEEIEAIDHALDKMGAMQYGKCEGCARQIPLPRLQAPAAPGARWLGLLRWAGRE